jgi:hypothetical protein
MITCIPTPTLTNDHSSTLAAPANIRGALVCQWQVWTAFGIAVGTAGNLAFLQIPNGINGTSGLNWRLMLGSAALPAVFVCAQVFFNPEVRCSIL